MKARKKRFGVLSPEIGATLFFVRLLRHIALRIVDNPATMAFLGFLGAASGKRSSGSDLYYYPIFRRNFLAGYDEAKRQARAARRPAATNVQSEWVNRGES